MPERRDMEGRDGGPPGRAAEDRVVRWPGRRPSSRRYPTVYSFLQGERGRQGPHSLAHVGVDEGLAEARRSGFDFCRPGTDSRLFLSEGRTRTFLLWMLTPRLGAPDGELEKRLRDYLRYRRELTEELGRVDGDRRYEIYHELIESHPLGAYGIDRHGLATRTEIAGKGERRDGAWRDFNILSRAPRWGRERSSGFFDALWTRLRTIDGPKPPDGPEHGRESEPVREYRRQLYQYARQFAEFALGRRPDRGEILETLSNTSFESTSESVFWESVQRGRADVLRSGLRPGSTPTAAPGSDRRLPNWVMERWLAEPADPRTTASRRSAPGEEPFPPGGGSRRRAGEPDGGAGGGPLAKRRRP